MSISSQALRAALFRSRALAVALVAAWSAVAFVAAAQAQTFQSGLGAQDRANAASQLITIGVQRGIDSLPVVSGQSVTYEFDPASDAFARSTRLGPTVFRSSQTIEPGSFSLQLAASYFEVNDSFRPINYLLTFSGSSTQQGVTRIGSNVEAHVGLLSISAAYGISSRFEVGASLPITVVDAQGTETFVTPSNSLSVPARDAQLGGVSYCNGNVQGCRGNVNGAIRALDSFLQPGGPFALRRASFSSLGYNFNEGTQAGVGRISLGGKAVLLTGTRLQVAFVPQFFFPSPSQDAYAGPDSAAILPQVAATLKLADAVKLHTDAGYDYDFDSAELRRFTWTSGASLSFERAAFDLGFGGSEFDEPVQWTPSIFHQPPTATSSGYTAYAIDNNLTGTTLVNLLLGIKVRVTDTMVIAGGVTIPIVNPGFQPDALGTIAVERTF